MSNLFGSLRPVSRLRRVLGALVLGAGALPGLAQAAPTAQCPWTGISLACDRQVQAQPPAGAAVNTPQPNDIGMDSYNVPAAPSLRARPPAPVCPFGYQSGPAFDTASWTWQYSCTPQAAQPAASVCPYGFASGPAFNPGSNSWSYTCAAAPALAAGLCPPPVALSTNVSCLDSYSWGDPLYPPSAIPGVPNTPYMNPVTGQMFVSGSPVDMMWLSFPPQLFPGSLWPVSVSFVSFVANPGQSGVFSGAATGSNSAGGPVPSTALPVTVSCNNGNPIQTCQVSGNIWPGYYRRPYYSSTPWSFSYTFNHNPPPPPPCSGLFCFGNLPMG